MAQLLTTIPAPNPEDSWDAREKTVISGLEILAGMLAREEIGFEWYTHDSQALLAYVGWDEALSMPNMQYSAEWEDQ